MENVEKSIDDIFNSIISRCTIEQRTGNINNERFQNEYEKNSSVEFKYGQVESQSLTNLATRQIENINIIKGLMEKMKNTLSVKEVSQLENQIYDVMTKFHVKDDNYDPKWRLTEEEFNKLKTNISIFANYARKEAKELFELQQAEEKRNNSFIGKLSSKKDEFVKKMNAFMEKSSWSKFLKNYKNKELSQSETQELDNLDGFKR